MERPNITINILPQSPDAWFFIAVAVAIVAIAGCAKSMTGVNEVEIAKIHAATQVELAKAAK